MAFGISSATCQNSFFDPKIFQYEGITYGCFTNEEGVLLYDYIQGYDSALVLMGLMEIQIQAHNAAFEQLHTTCQDQGDTYKEVIAIDNRTHEIEKQQLERIIRRRTFWAIIATGVVVILVI